ncbi:uncharacterized protein LOC124712540 [Schistocerca piceifrons]|uniref:uncharacterized protein LOC124712540 n=1 Tax=Schistocerca piceifrons TaxID=274613 RepID=UPI001F5E6CB9|nr:uncharacterized protein LOC124712540 [Schistocerca piceifrons]
MPKVKSEKRNSPSKSPLEGEKKSGWGSGGQLFGSETNENTFQGAGFKDKDKALETLKLLDGRDISYQFQIINSMYHRAKVILKRTKDEEKVHNLTEAIEVFENWINDYKAHNRSRENFSYLPLETVDAYKPLAQRYGVFVEGEKSFLHVYKEAEGDHKKLRQLKVDKDDENGITWDIHRNKNLKEISTRIKTEHLPLFETDIEYRGLPSKEHVEMIQWGYSPEVTKIKKLIPQIAEKLNGATKENMVIDSNGDSNSNSSNGSSVNEDSCKSAEKPKEEISTNGEVAAEA